MTFEAAYALLLGVNLMARSVLDLLPRAISPLVAIFASLRWDKCMLANLVGLVHGVLYDLLHTGYRAGLVATVTAYFRMLACRPLVPRVLHRVARSTECRIVLDVVVDAVGAKGAEGDESDDKGKDEECDGTG